jgi:hypothetical protein
VEATQQAQELVPLGAAQNPQVPRFTGVQQLNGTLLPREPRIRGFDEEGSAIVRMPDTFDVSPCLEIVEEEDHRALVDADRRTECSLGHRFSLDNQGEDAYGPSRKAELIQHLVGQGGRGLLPPAIVLMIVRPATVALEQLTAG